jgi:hypothetical protein
LGIQKLFFPQRAPEEVTDICKIVFHFKFLCEIFHSTPVGDKFEPKKLDTRSCKEYQTERSHFKHSKTLQFSPQQCCLPEYLLMSMCKHLQTWRQKKEVARIWSTNLCFAEAAKIIGIKNNNGCVIYECRNNPVRIMISKMPLVLLSPGPWKDNSQWPQLSCLENGSWAQTWRLWWRYVMNPLTASFRRHTETINNDIITRPITSTLSHSVINKCNHYNPSYPLISSHMPGCVFCFSVFIIGCQIMFRSCSNRPDGSRILPVD